MSENSGIEWTTHTFNPWWGCTKVHAGCTNCYAESFDKRVGGSHWGNGPRRMVIGEWGKPTKWDRAAHIAGRRDRVFCASMCDLFEDYDGPVVDQQGNPVKASPGMVWTVPALRERVWTVIESTPNLIWLLLTKRPENVTRMVPPAWLTNWPANAWTGTSPCNQETADASIPPLLAVPGPHFLSAEPLLGSVNLSRISLGLGENIDVADGPPQEHVFSAIDRHADARVHWVIVGCESRGKASGRFSDGYEAAARSIIEQCRRAGVPVFNKQMPLDGRVSHEMSEWPEDMRVREFPESHRKATP